MSKVSPAEIAANHQHILVRTRSGTKLHLAMSAGTSVTNCGHWLKYAAGHFAVRPTEIPAILDRYQASLCERCGTPETFKRALGIDETEARS